CSRVAFEKSASTPICCCVFTGDCAGAASFFVQAINAGIPNTSNVFVVSILRYQGFSFLTSAGVHFSGCPQPGSSRLQKSPAFFVAALSRLVSCFTLFW